MIRKMYNIYMNFHKKWSVNNWIETIEVDKVDFLNGGVKGGASSSS